jgi:2-polyprenyl-3-methyl-5-hydroxy-6-metoxy-1,4-benzoquinol methylase
MAQSNLFQYEEQAYTCPLCHADGFICHAFPKISVCPKCGLYFRDPAPSQTQIIASYNEGKNYEWWQDELEIRTYLWRKRINLILPHQSHGRLLDIGTGDGFFLNFVPDTFDVVSTEISTTGVTYARNRGHDTLLGDFMSLDFEPASFDVITLWHVLEHVPDPGAMLDKIARILKPGGLLAVAVPNETLPLWSARLRRPSLNPWGDFIWGNEIHLSHFTPRTFKTALQAYGFHLENFGVDDVHCKRPLSKMVPFHFNRLLNTLCRWHMDTAMCAVATKR